MNECEVVHALKIILKSVFEKLVNCLDQLKRAQTLDWK